MKPLSAKMLGTLIAALLAFILPLSAVGCDGGFNSMSPAAKPASVRVAMSVAALQAVSHVQVDSAVLVVTAPDISGQGRWLFLHAAGADSVGGLIGVPVGLNRLFTVDVYAAGRAVAEGSGVVNIVPGTNAPFAISIAILPAGPSVAGATGYITVVITATEAPVSLHIAPKAVALTGVGDTVSFSMVDSAGTPYTAGRPRFEVLNSFCGFIQLGERRVTAMAPNCTFQVVGSIGSIADTATVTIH